MLARFTRGLAGHARGTTIFEDRQQLGGGTQGDPLDGDQSASLSARLIPTSSGSGGAAED